MKKRVVLTTALLALMGNLGLPGQAQVPQEISSSPYTLIDYEKPGSPLTADVQPALNQAQMEFKTVQQIHLNSNSRGALRKFKPTQDNSYPEAVLVDSQGKVLTSWRGNHVIANTLIKEMHKYVK